MKTKLLLLLLLLTQGIACADVSAPLNVEEADGDPSTYPYKIKVTNGSLTDNLDGTVNIAVNSSSDLSCTDCVTLSSETTGNYVATLTESTGMDVANGSTEGGAATVALDSTEIGTTTWGSGSDLVWTFNTNGASDMTFSFADGLMTTNFPIQYGGTGSSLEFEGATADSFETVLTAVDPTIDATISLPKSTGTVALSTAMSADNGAISAGRLDIYEDTDNGTNKATITVPALAADTNYTLPSDDGDAGEQLQTNGSGTLSWEAAGGSGSPGGSDTYVQYNDASAFGGDAGFTFNETTNSVTVDGSITFGGATGATISADTGVVRIQGINGTNNENITIDLESSSTNATFGTSTGLTGINMNGFDLTLTQGTPAFNIIDNTGSSDDFAIQVDGNVMNFLNTTDTETVISEDATDTISVGSTGNPVTRIKSPSVIFEGSFTSVGNDSGWTIVDQADNQVCTTGCTSACVFGWDGTTPVSCNSALADICLCAGSS